MSTLSPQRYSVKIHVLKAENLIRKNFFGSSPNPYCKIHLDFKQQKQHTSVKTKTLFPTWNEIFYINNVGLESTLYIRVFDKSSFKPEGFLGMTQFAMKDYINVGHLGQTKIYSRTLKPHDGKDEKVTGSIVIGLRFLENRTENSSATSSLNGSSNSNQNQDGLPEGWEARKDHMNRTYYVNTTTGKSQWTHPSEIDSAPVTESMRRIELASSSNASINQTQSPSRTITRAMRAEDLPSGWEQRRTQDGRIFFVNHNNRTTQWEDPRLSTSTTSTTSTTATTSTEPSRDTIRRRREQSSTMRSTHSSTSATNTNLGPLPPGWEQRVHTDGKIYFIDHINRKTQWEDPRLANQVVSTQSVPKYIRDFSAKQEVLRQSLTKPNPKDKVELRLRRKSVFEDTYKAFSRLSSADLRKRLWIIFDEEEGLDYGGVTREWFHLLSKELFNPSYCLFEYSAQGNYTLQISPNSDVNPDHLKYFFFIGRVFGTAIFHGKFIDSFFVPSFYKRILNLPITLGDIASVDPERYNSLLWMLENDITDILYETFSVVTEKFGEKTIHELKPGGKDVDVTEKNKKEYVDLFVQWKSVAGTKEQMDMIIKGLSDVIDLNLIKNFDPREFEYLLSGLPEVDVEDWQKNTVYKNYHSSESVIKWFWKIVKSMNTEQKAKLLQFVTGTTRIPATGFKDLWGSDGPRKFCIEKWGTPESLPRSHTCFNRIDLPPYESYDILKKKLQIALEQTEGFAIE